MYTFVVRIRQDGSLQGTRWYGRVEHLQSGRTLAFQKMEKLVDFIHSSGAIENHNHRDGRESKENE
jgi:hypothetical protein